MFRSKKCMSKYETDKRYPSQYSFNNGASSWQLVGDLSPWCKERRGACIGSSNPLKTEQHLIPISLSCVTFGSQWPYSAEALLVSPTVSTHDGLTYDRANSSALQATTLRATHERAIVNDAQPVINDTSAKMTSVVDDLCGR